MDRIEYIDGFYEMESDGIHDFHWMKKNGVLKINEPSEFDFIQLEIACPIKEQETAMLRINNKIYETKLLNCWQTVNVFAADIEPLKDGIINMNCDFLLDTYGTDTRELSLMVGNISVCKAEMYDQKKYIYIKKINNNLGNVFYNCIKDSSDGIIVLDDNVKSDCNDIYMDCIFDNFTNCNDTFHIKTYNNNVEKEYTMKPQKYISFSIKLPYKKEWYFFIDHYLKLEKIYIRKNFYDFYNLFDDISVKALVNRAKTESIAKSLGLKLQWFVTWACNYRCPYCWEESNRSLYRKEINDLNSVAPQLWANGFNRLNPSVIYFTGGEPTLYKKLPELINLINPTTKIFITTNFGNSFSMDKYETIFYEYKFSSFTASFHPSEISINDFLGKMDVCVEKEFNKYCDFGIEMVLHPNNMQYVNILIEYCKNQGIRLYLDKFNDPISKYKITKSELIFIDEARKTANKINKGINQYNKNKTYINNMELFSDHAFDRTANNNIRNRQLIWCAAGMESIHVDERGDVYQCMSAIDRGKLFGETSLPHYNKLGNILKDENVLLDMPILCGESYRCSACDYMYHGKAMTSCELKNGRTLQLPIPE